MPLQHEKTSTTTVELPFKKHAANISHLLYREKRSAVGEGSTHIGAHALSSHLKTSGAVSQ